MLDILIPFFYTKETNLSDSYYQELTGYPKFSNASLHTCHALRTPTDPPESYQSDSFVLASVNATTLPSALISITVLYHASRERLSPCGLHDSLCTLRVGRSTGCLSFPITQHSVRVVGQTLPGRDFHPVRSTKLCLAHHDFLLLYACNNLVHIKT